jgi:hypothetical protein
MRCSSGSLLCAIRGPILMITLGGLLAIDRFGSYSFTRTWPVLIIVLGVLKLLQLFADSSYNGAGPQSGGVQ